MRKSGVLLIGVLFAAVGLEAATVVLTAHADADIRSFKSENSGFNRDTLSIKNAGIDPSASDSAKAYVCFKIPKGFGPITSAKFTMTRTVLGTYGSLHEVYGLNDGEDELKWTEANESGLCWNDAAGNVTDSPSGFKDAVLTGTFETRKAAAGGRVGDSWSISSPELVKFLNTDSNGYVTLMVGRMQQSSSADQWASKENGKFPGPTLTIDTGPGFNPSIVAAATTPIMSKDSTASTVIAGSAAAMSGSVASKRWHAWRTSRKEYPLAAWSYFQRFPGSRQEYQIYKDAGFNYVQSPQEQVDNARAAGLDLMMGGFRDVHTNISELVAMVEFANKHPGEVSVYSLKDEPVPADFQNVAKAVSYIYAHDMAGALPIIDFRANWCVPYKRWKMTYETCYERFLETVNPPVLLNCHYPLKLDGTTRSSFYANVEFFRRLALQRDVGLMGFVQVTAHAFTNSTEIQYRTPSESDMNWIVNTHLAYGAQGLWFYNWRIQDERFGKALVDGESGAPTSLYPMVQKINVRVKALGSILMKLKSQAVVHTDEIVPEGTTRYAPGMVKGIYDFAGKSFIVSQFYNQD
ncbi:MAG: hypothetical protein WCG03_10365, partial [Kiritimatiellales bacterium]